MGGSFTDEFGDVASGVGSFLGNAWDGAQMMGGGIIDAAQSQEGNPVFQGLGAIMAFALAYSFAPRILAGLGLDGDGFAGRFSRGSLSLVVAVGAAMSAAAGVGMMREDAPVPPAEIHESAVDNDALNGPAVAALPAGPGPG